MSFKDDSLIDTRTVLKKANYVLSNIHRIRLLIQLPNNTRWILDSKKDRF